jgi:hypothetical protein
VRLPHALLILPTLLVSVPSAMAQQPPAKIDVDWGKTLIVSRTTPTLQVVVNPPLRRGSTIHDRAFAELHALGADYVRFVPWLPYPRLAVAELKPPMDGKTAWDFSLIDPLVEDFFEATRGHPVVLNFSTIPQWMFVTPSPVTYPDDPDKVTWNYTQGTELRDPSGEELGDYYSRLVSWYLRGGFVDESGQRHSSQHHYKVDYWEVLNEPDLEHNTTPEQYTARYDAIVAKVRRVAPEMKFVGISVAYPRGNPEFFEYFLNPKNHRPGTPLDMISYHFYAAPKRDETPEVHQFTFWEQADHFVDTVRFIESIRQRLAPATRTMINELGSILPGDNQWTPDQAASLIAPSYWNLSGSLYAYLFGRLSALGTDVVGESQLVGYPTQFPSVSMLDWNNGAPNARFRVLELLKSNFRPGDRLVETRAGDPAFYAQGFLTATSQRKLLIVNKRARRISVLLPASGAMVQVVDQSTGSRPSASRLEQSQVLTLDGFAVAVVSLP